MIVLRHEINCLHRSISQAIREVKEAWSFRQTVGGLHAELEAKLAELSRQKVDVESGFLDLKVAKDKVPAIFPVSNLATSQLLSDSETTRKHLYSLDANRRVPAYARPLYRAAFESRETAIAIELLPRYRSGSDGDAADICNAGLDDVRTSLQEYSCTAPEDGMVDYANADPNDEDSDEDDGDYVPPGGSVDSVADEDDRDNGFDSGDDILVSDGDHASTKTPTRSPGHVKGWKFPHRPSISESPHSSPGGNRGAQSLQGNVAKAESAEKDPGA